jgi:hypothetical protein
MDATPDAGACTVISFIDPARLRLSDEVVRKNEVCFGRVKRV